MNTLTKLELDFEFELELISLEPKAISNCEE